MTLLYRVLLFFINRLIALPASSEVHALRPVEVLNQETLYLPASILDQLDVYAEQHRISRSQAVLALLDKASLEHQKLAKQDLLNELKALQENLKHR